MAEAARIVATAVRDPFVVIREFGGDPAEYCRAAGFDAAIASEEAATLPLSSYVALSQQAARRLGAPHFGRIVGGRFDIANIGGVGLAALGAPTLGAAFRLIEQAFTSVQSESDFRLDVEGGLATVSYRILDESIWPRDQDAELTLGVFASLLSRAAGKGWRPRAIAFEHGPNGADTAPGSDLRSTIRYEARENALSFDASLLDLAMPGAQPSVFRPIMTTLIQDARRREHQDSIAARVRRAILRDLGRAPVDQTRVASILGLSRRTLRRRLEDEGIGFALPRGTRQAVARRNPARNLRNLRPAWLLGGVGIRAGVLAPHRPDTGQLPWRQQVRHDAGRGPAPLRPDGGPVHCCISMDSG